MKFVAVVIPDPFNDGRYLVCRRTKEGWTTAVTSHHSAETAERERQNLQRGYDFDNAKPPVDSNQPRQLVLGFYGPEQGD